MSRTNALRATPHPSAFSCHLLLKEKAFLQTAFESKSQRLEPLAGSVGLLALVQTTRLTGGYDLQKSM